MRRRVLIGALVLIGGCGSLTAWRVATGLADRRARAAERERLKNARVVASVETHEVYRRPIDLTVEGFGEVAAYRTVTVSAEVAGRLTAVDFDEGDTVAADQVLATCDRVALELAVREVEARLAAAEANLEKLRRLTRPEEKEAARAAQARAQALLDEAATQFERDERLYTDNVIGKSEYDGSLARFKAAEADRRNAAEQLRLLEAGARTEDFQAADAQVRQLKALRDAASDREAKATVAAPPIPSAPQATKTAGGFWAVAEKYVEAGQYVQAGTPIASLIETDRVKVRVFVPETEVGSVRRGMAASVRVDAYPDARFSGEVTTIAPRGDSGTKTFKVEVTVGNADGRLRPPMTARVAIAVEHVPDQMVVPINAVVIQDGQSYVFVLPRSAAGADAGPGRGRGRTTGPGRTPASNSRPGASAQRPRRVARRAVEILRQAGNEYHIDGDLECGDQVVTLGREVLKDSSPVRVMKVHRAPDGTVPGIRHPAPGTDAATLPSGRGARL